MYRTFGPGGAWWEWDCRLNVVVLFSQGGGFAPCKGPHHEMQAVYVDTVVARGVASVRRNLDRTSYWVLRCGPSFGNNCHSYSGSQTVTVTPVADALLLDRSPADVERGASVMFHARARDGGPVTVHRWTWVPDLPAPGEPGEQAVCGTETICVHTVSESGTLYVTAWVASRIEQASHRFVFPDPVFVVDVDEVHSEDGIVRPGTEVTFRARTTDGAAFDLMGWSWEADEADGRTTPCAGTDTLCRTAVYESGIMGATAIVAGEELRDGARVEVEALAVEVRIVEVETFGPGRSFTTLPAERNVHVRAEVVPAGYAPSIYWEVVDAPDDEVAAVAPGAVGTGDVVQWAVPAQQVSRWNDVPHPGTLDQKSLALRVVARVTVGGEVHESEPEDVKQDELDTIRQEYLDFGRSRLPARDDLGTRSAAHFSASELNAGDYSQHWAETALLDGLENLRRELRGTVELEGLTFRGLVVTSGSGTRSTTHCTSRPRIRKASTSTDWRPTSASGTMSQTFPAGTSST